MTGAVSLPPVLAGAVAGGLVARRSRSKIATLTDRARIRRRGKRAGIGAAAGPAVGIAQGVLRE